MSKYDGRGYELKKERMLGKELNEVRIVGKITSRSGVTKRMNGDYVIQFKVATHSDTYHSFKYENRTIEHNILARDPQSIKVVQSLNTFDFVEVVGHLVYGRSPKGIVAEIIASSVLFREDLMPTVGVKPKSNMETYPDSCGLPEITDDDEREAEEASELPS